MKIFKGEKRKIVKWQIAGVCISAIVALCYTGVYSYFQLHAEDNMYYPMESRENLRWMYESSYYLYQLLYNQENFLQKDPLQLYMEPKTNYQWLWEKGMSEDNTDILNDFTKRGFPRYKAEMYLDICHTFSSYFDKLEGCSQLLNNYYDYLAEDMETGAVISNFISKEEYAEIGYENLAGHVSSCMTVSFIFDQNGAVQLGPETYGKHTETVRRDANNAIYFFRLTDKLESRANASLNLYSFGTVHNPKNFRVTYFLSDNRYREILKDGTYPLFYEDSMKIELYQMDSVLQAAYRESGTGNVLRIICVLMLLATLCLPVLKCGAGEQKFSLLPPEVLIAGYGVMYALTYLVVRIIPKVCYNVIFMAYEINFILFAFFFFAVWALGIQTKAVLESGVIAYFRDKSLLLRLSCVLKGKAIREYDRVIHMDLTQSAKRLIASIILVNTGVLFAVCCICLYANEDLGWIGFIIAAPYSAIAYGLLRKYVSDTQKGYRILLKAVNALGEGNLNAAIEEDMGIFENFRPEVAKVREGIEKAVEEQTKSQRMKAELITNVSHDLKTPLTAIITYIKLLQEDAEEEKRKEYLDVLETKSLRLKALIEDLFEISKANSQNASLHLTDIDILNLVKQVVCEMEEQFAEADLELRMNLGEEKAVLSLDSQKTYRIFENLFGNIVKYAMPGTRVYVEKGGTEEEISISLKNISAEEIQVSPEELTERFVRGDHARHTEGSGLGLAIAKSFIELQGGRLILELDGDLFKATACFPRHNTEEPRI